MKKFVLISLKYRVISHAPVVFNSKSIILLYFLLHNESKTGKILIPRRTIMSINANQFFILVERQFYFIIIEIIISLKATNDISCVVIESNLRNKRVIIMIYGDWSNRYIWIKIDCCFFINSCFSSLKDLRWHSIW